MADVSLIQDDPLDDSDEGVFEQGDGPTGEHIDDESLPLLVRIQKYALSENIFDRQMVPRIILELFRTGPANLFEADLPDIMNIVSKLAEEDEIMVRTDILEQISNLAVTAFECSTRVPSLNNLFNDHLLPLILRNLGTNDNQVRKTAQSSLLQVVEKGLVSQQQAELQVCPTVLALSNIESVMDCHTGTVMLMSKLAPLFGRDITERMFLRRFSQLCSNQIFHVRKMCASHFGDFCAVTGKEAYEHVLLPCYIALCADDIWGVRKACAEVIMSVSCACPSLMRRSALAPVFARLLQDQSRWVRMSAFQTLGPFISTFADPTITNIAYNNSRELVLINNEGTEFRISPAYTEANIRSVGELQMLYQFHERSKSMEHDQHHFIEKDDNDDVIFNPLLDLENSSDESCEQIKIDNIALELLVGPASESTLESNEETDANKHEGDEEETVPDLEENLLKTDDQESNPSNSGDNESLDIRDLVKKVMLDFSSFFEDVDNVNKFFRPAETNPDACDNLDKSLNQDINELSEKIRCTDLINNEHNYIMNENPSSKPDGDINGEISVNVINDTSVDNQNANCTDTKNENELEEYNSYNYWYVSPDMPLDPNVITPKNDGQNHETEKSEDIFDAAEGGDNNWEPIPYPKMDKFPMYIDYHLNNSMGKQKTEEPMVQHEEEPPATTNYNTEEPPQHIVPQLLIDHFVSMTDPYLAQNTDNEMAYHCAYSLPAVALTLGSKNWYLLKDTVEVLAANMQYKVRRTVASSLHELAMILGPDIATNNLTPIFEGFIKDLDEVRIGVLKHLAHFLRLISPSKRNVYLPRLAEFLQIDNEANWRFRRELAEQLLMAVPLFRATDSSNKHISFIAQELLCDKVAAVREVALLLVTELIRHTSSDQSLTSWLLVKLAEKFAHSKRWKLRQSFALLCSDILKSKALSVEQFASEVMPHLLDLSWDPVPNVRLVVARTISQHIVTNEYFADVSSQHYDGLQTVLRRLQFDKDNDVRQSAILQTVMHIQ